MQQFEAVNTAGRILLGPGPSGVHPRVLRAFSMPTIGHLDPEFLGIMNATKQMLQHVFGTANELTIPISGTGSAGMETALVNFIEPGDRVLICISGLFGQRMADVASRCGAQVDTIEVPWGQSVQPDQVEEALAEAEAKGGRVKLVGIVHAETSTGVLQPVAEVAKIAHAHGALIVVDAVTSLGGAPVDVDANDLDIVYSGTQKCLSCPPGLAPLTVGRRGLDVLRARSTKVQSWYLDLTMLMAYWGAERFYHHTAPVNMIYALHESLRLIVEEGLEARYARHRLHAEALKAGLEGMGLALFAQEGFRAPMLTTVTVPEGIDEVAARKRLLAQYGIEIGGGLGPLKGKIFRIGLMGYSCTKTNVMLILTGLAEALAAQGFNADGRAALEAAAVVYEASA
ncbi:MAG: alanine--glyoxylate aminotransferase family protein [Bacillota bacterium]|jgi:alanine-glyoxylate transaminase/serine-glyoxylate transaminase/serine-pyruvate transaminase|nr:alanine--glyoxylate aminotransferase family protein [Bacillota bacterium]